MDLAHWPWLKIPTLYLRWKWNTKGKGEYLNSFSGTKKFIKISEQLSQYFQTSFSVIFWNQSFNLVHDCPHLCPLSPLLCTSLEIQVRSTDKSELSTHLWPCCLQGKTVLMMVKENINHTCGERSLHFFQQIGPLSKMNFNGLVY